jgi:hypothetical protein
MLTAVVVSSGAPVRRRLSDAQQAARPAAETYLRRGWAVTGMAW